jgi:hypothetical protein
MILMMPAPSVTSGGDAGSIDENSGAGQVIYTATADDSDDISGGVTFSLSDASEALSINANTWSCYALRQS